MAAEQQDSAPRQQTVQPSENNRRVYISNLSFDTTEDELTEYLLEYNVLSVLIPSQTIRGFRNSRVRPLGIAYADFESADKAKEAIEALNGKVFNNRTLRLKPYVAYSPAVVSRKPSKANKEESRFSKLKVKKSTSVSPVSEEQELPEETRGSANNEQTTEPEAQPLTDSGQNEEPVSKDTVYCGYLPSKATDVELREFFKEYEPTDIYVFKNRSYKKGFHFHRYYLAALVTLDKENGVQQSVENLSKEKLMGKKVTLRAAYLSKIDEVKKAAVKKNEAREAAQDTGPAGVVAAAATAAAAAAAGAGAATTNQQTREVTVADGN